MVLLDSLRVFLKAYEQASKSTQIPLPRPKIENGSTLWKDNLFAYFPKDIREHSNSQIRLSLRFEQYNKCVFSIKKFDLQGDHLILAEIVSNFQHKVYRLYQTRYLVGYKCGFCESNYDI